MIKRMGGLAMLAGLAIGQALPPPLPSIPPGGFSMVLAAGSPTTVPRHAAVAVGISEAISPTQDFFLTVMLGPSAASSAEQESVLLGLTQSLGTVSLAGLQMKSWGSAAFGTALSNAAKINLQGTAAAAVASASTNAAFSSQYVLGFGHQPKWCASCEMGPILKYIHTVGQPSEVVMGLYLKWKP